MSSAGQGRTFVLRTHGTSQFLDGTRRGVFLLQRCAVCDATASPKATQCPECLATALQPSPASGMATVVSWSVVHGRATDADPAPRTVLVIAELDEGPWWWSRLETDDPDAVSAGMRIQVDFALVGEESVPIFRRAQRHSSSVQSRRS